MGGPRRRRIRTRDGCEFRKARRDDLEAIPLGKAPGVRIEIVFRNLGGEFAFVRVGRVFDGAYEFGLVILAFLDELFDALGIGALDVGESFEIAGLAG
jgi:hypothetical protein